MSISGRPRRGPPVGVLAGIVLAVLVVLGGVLFWLAENASPSSGSTTEGALAVFTALVVLVVPA